MKHSKPAWLAILPLTAAIAVPASAVDPIVVDKAWPQLDYAADGTCEGEIRSNGQVYLINAIGLGAEQPGRYYLTNQDMPPIDWEIVTGPNGELVRYYIPYLPDEQDGTVNVTIATQSCVLSLSFDWASEATIEPWATRRAMGVRIR